MFWNIAAAFVFHCLGSVAGPQQIHVTQAGGYSTGLLNGQPPERQTVSLTLLDYFSVLPMST
jgi:hypothetical protein